MKSDQLLQKKEKFDPKVLREKIAELPSLYSETIVQVTLNVRSAREALILIYLSTYFPYWSTDKLIDSIRQKCFYQNYEGKWEIVQEFLELDLQTPEQFEKEYISRKGAFDFFGNFLRESYRLSLILKIRDLSKPSKHKVKKPVYRRGYKDKGSLRLPHENHGDRPISSIERVDRRQKVMHPLLRENFLAVGDDANFTHPERSDFNDN